MFNTLDEYTKEKEYLIAFDSDGCVFNNMTVKHQDYFFPALLELFGYEDNSDEKFTLWNKINLDYPLRGINRFLGLYEFFKVFPPEESIAIFAQWIKTANTHKHKSLEDQIRKVQDPLMIKVLLWSKTINSRIKEKLNHIEPFEGAVECVIESSKKADIVVISSANQDAVIREWKEAGLLPYVRFVASQDAGSKVDCLHQLCEKGYKVDHVLMVGDARGDYLAAKDNYAYYYQIKYKSEQESWRTLENEAMYKFFEGTYQYDGEEVLSLALEDGLKVVKCNVDRYTDRFQHVSKDGVYPLEENKLWTMGFYPGQLYLAYAMTKDKTIIRNKEAILKSFQERCDSGHMDTHDIGFLYELTAYYDYKYTGSETSKALLIQAADKLMKRYHEKGGYIQAWGKVDPGNTETRIIIDCMMNLPLLYIVSELTGDDQYAKAAMSHARVSGNTLIREDYSSFHTYWMDILSGQPLYGKTHQGHRDASTWARGQAWAIYGFYKSYEYSGEEEFLDIAIKCADVFINNTPKNDICYWDFDFTNDYPDIRDSSAASIAAAALLKLAKVVEGDLGIKYEKEAIQLLKCLANRYQNNNVYQGCGILKEGMYHRDEGASAFTSWGDYYYLEALYTLIHNSNRNE